MGKRIFGLAAQIKALLHAEAVLLIDYGEAEPVDRHVVLDECVSTHNDARLELRFSLPLRHAGMQPADLDTVRDEPGLELAIVLLGKDLGRRHDGGAPACL